MASLKNPQPQPTEQWIGSDGKPKQGFAQYISAVTALLVSGQLGPFTQATNDAAAAVAGVPVNGVYRNGNALQVRLK